jgi:hypothetical protein
MAVTLTNNTGATAATGEIGVLIGQVVRGYNYRTKNNVRRLYVATADIQDQASGPFDQAYNNGTVLVKPDAVNPPAADHWFGINSSGYTVEAGAIRNLGKAFGYPPKAAIGIVLVKNYQNTGLDLVHFGVEDAFRWGRQGGGKNFGGKVASASAFRLTAVRQDPTDGGQYVIAESLSGHDLVAAPSDLTATAIRALVSGSGTASCTNASKTLTFSQSQTLKQGASVVLANGQKFTVKSGSGTSWTTFQAATVTASGQTFTTSDPSPTARTLSGTEVNGANYFVYCAELDANGTECDPYWYLDSLAPSFAYHPVTGDAWTGHVVYVDGSGNFDTGWMFTDKQASYSFMPGTSNWLTTGGSGSGYLECDRSGVKLARDVFVPAGGLLRILLAGQLTNGGNGTVALGLDGTAIAPTVTSGNPSPIWKYQQSYDVDTFVRVAALASYSGGTSKPGLSYPTLAIEVHG